MYIQNLPILKINELTQKQFDKLVKEGLIDETAIFLTPDEEIQIDLSGYATIEYVNNLFQGKVGFSWGDFSNNTSGTSSVIWLTF